MKNDALTKKLILEARQGHARRLRALMIKEFLQIIRDPSSLLITVFLPLLLIFLYGSGVSLDLDHLRIGLVMEDTSPQARSFAEAVTGSRYFEVKMVRDRRELDDDLIRGDIRGMIVVPSYFTQYLMREDQMAPIQVIADGSETNTANFVQNYAQGVFQNWLVQEGFAQGLDKELPVVRIEPRFWYNAQVESRFFILPGSLAITMTLIGALLTALVVAREWGRGTMEALMSTTVGIRELVIGKVVPYFCLGMCSMAICVAISVFCYDVPLRGSILALGVVSALFLFCSLGLGPMISTLTKNQVLASQITLVVALFPAYILSGFIFEIHSVPEWIQCITYIIPARYFVQSLLTLFLVGDAWHLIIYDMAPIVLIGLVFFLITASKTVKRLD